MNYIKHIFLACAAIFIFYSCENFFETQVELPITEHTPILAVSSFLDNNSGAIFVDVNRTFGLFEDIPLDRENTVFGATVEFFEEGELLTTLEYDESNSKYSQQMSGEFLTVDNEYELRVSHPDFETVSATQTLPAAIPLTEVTHRVFESSNFSGYDGEIKVTFNDPPGEENYYEFFAGRRTYVNCLDEDGNIVDSDSYFDEFYFDTEGPENPEATEGFGYETLLIDDATFDGQTKTFSAKYYRGGFGGNGGICFDANSAVFSYEITDTKIVVFWRTITKDFYRYSLSLKQNREAIDNPFAEPVSVYTNFDNGIGAFCLRSDLEYEIEE